MNVNTTLNVSILITAASIAVFPTQILSNSDIPSSAAALPVNAGICIDHDGDGWGWTGTESCTATAAPTVTTHVATPLVQAKVQSDCIDTNGDGWGWHNGSRCQANVIAQAPVLHTATQATISSPQVYQSSAIAKTVATTSSCVDSDGDGWGWDGKKSCRVGISTQPDSTTFYSSDRADSSESTVPENCENIDSGNYHITELVTDVFLSAGQSNATGNQTHYNSGYASDRVNSRVIVWTENNRWEIANPQTQIWHEGRRPHGHNHPAFQIARGIADNDACRVVAFVATAASGMPINYWLNNVDQHYSSILNKVTNALNALPRQYKVDMIWWMQGEADNDQITDRYSLKLTALINRFRSQNWFRNDGLFLANETRIHTYANQAIRQLAKDGDIYTDFSHGEDSSSLRFPSILPNGVHFNAQSLRQIGDLVADKYVYEYLPHVNR